VTRLAPVSPARASDLVQRFARLHVCVVGDLMIDRFVVGRVTRISPEAPVPVVHFEREYSRLGGAANVAQNLRALGARVTLVGVVGADPAAERLGALLDSSGIPRGGVVVDGSRPTTEKVRIVTDRNQQVARIDYEQDLELQEPVRNEVLARIETHAKDAHALLVSDYLKGAITPAVMQALVVRKTATVPLVVDPKIPHLDSYAGATIITPNHHEAEAATHRRIRSESDVQSAARDFRRLAGCESVLITRGEHGLWLSGEEVEGGVPAVAREVADVTGAGDTVVATLALALAAGASLSDAAVLANQAAGVVVGKFGPAAVSADELMSAITDRGASV
jgi:D-beta-D-heptose 7-phosphate kinase/D-beta-D-heptose 1-phosphate adenosyltransferase